MPQNLSGRLCAVCKLSEQCFVVCEWLCTHFTFCGQIYSRFVCARASVAIVLCALMHLTLLLSACATVCVCVCVCVCVQ